MRQSTVALALLAGGLSLAVILSYGGFDVEMSHHDRAEHQRNLAAGKAGRFLAERPPLPASPDELAAIVNSGGSMHHHSAPQGDARGADGAPPADAVVGKPPAPVTAAGGGDGTSDGGGDAKTALSRLRRDFVEDPSLATRCKLPPVRTPEAKCVPAAFATAARRPMLVGPKSKGETTKGMSVHPMEELLPTDPRPAFIHSAEGGNGTVAHHPIVQVFAQRTYHDKLYADRVTEFNGVHAAAAYDCTEAIDFRQYHQVRALLCDMHEGFVADRASTVDGMFPLVDEEYMEYAMTLTVAFEAAKLGRPFTYIELGARYGTWIVRAGASYRLFGGPAETLKLLAVEGNCEWYRKMGEHVACNHLEPSTDLILAYAAPVSYNKVALGDASTYKQPRAVSLLQMIRAYDFVDLVDFDIQGFEAQTTEEDGVMALMTERVGFAHFGTHGADIEAKLLRRFQRAGWVVIYFYAGAHTKKLNHGHRCMTPFGPSVFNDGALGFANPKFYPKLREAQKTRPPVVQSAKRKGKGALTCYFAPEASQLLFRELDPATVDITAAG